MASGTRFGRALSWAAGIGALNWLVRKRSTGATGDVTVQVSPPSVDQSVRTEVYRLRGEAVTVGGQLEWALDKIASRFARSTKKKPKRQWKDLKRFIRDEGVGVKPKHIEAVGNYFGPRNLAAHGWIFYSGVAGTTQIHRFSRDGGESLTLDDLEDEVKTVRKGFDSLQAIGRALDDHDSSVLADVDPLLKSVLLGHI